MILSCSNISKAFGTEEILKHVSFHVEDHEKAAIVGINGAGKSTLAKLILGLYPPTQGAVTVEDGAVTQPCGAEQGTTQDGCIGRSAVFQNYMRYQMTLQDNVTISDPKKNAPVKPLLELSLIHI